MATLDHSHRCDRCPSRAYGHVVLYSGLELFFCGHHLKKHRAALDEVALNILDETGELTVHIADDKHVV